jgi:hypothetical protein
MDPITGAIVAAATAGVTEISKKAIVDAYNALKAKIQAKFGDESKIVEAVKAVEEEPEFEPNQAALTGRIEQVDAAKDEELQTLAQALLDALQDTSAGQKAVSKYSIQATDSEIGVIGDNAQIEGGIHFGQS